MQGQPAWDNRCFTSPKPRTPAGEPGARPSIGLPGPPLCSARSTFGTGQVPGLEGGEAGGADGPAAGNNIRHNVII